MAVVKEFVLVRWIEEDQIGVMPISAVVKTKPLSIGAVVGVKWKPGQITLEEVKGGQDSEDCSMVTTSTPNEIGECSSSSRPGATKSLSQSNSKPKPATSKGKAKGTKSAATKPASTIAKNLSQKKQKEAAKIAAAQKRASTIFADLTTSDSESDGYEYSVPKLKKAKKQQTEPLEKKLTSGIVCTLSESDEYITDDSNLGSANSSLLLDEMDKQKKIIVDLKKKLKALSKSTMCSTATDNSEGIGITGGAGDSNNSKRGDTEEPFLQEYSNKVSYKTSSPIQTTNRYYRAHTKSGRDHHTAKVELKYVELVPGYGVTCAQRQIDEVKSSSNRSPTRMIRLLMNVFFTDDELATSSCYGSGQTSTRSLDSDVVAACIKFVKDHYDVSKSVLVTAINDKCAQARTKKRQNQQLAV